MSVLLTLPFSVAQRANFHPQQPVLQPLSPSARTSVETFHIDNRASKGFLRLLHLFFFFLALSYDRLMQDFSLRHEDLYVFTLPIHCFKLWDVDY